MGDKKPRPRGADGKFLPVAGSAVKLRGPDGKVRTYRAADSAAARVAQQVKPAQPSSSQ